MSTVEKKQVLDGQSQQQDKLVEDRQSLSIPKQEVPRPWIYSARGIAVRLFITCWFIYTLHFATNIVREVYLALAIGDHLSFRVDEYANMHPDLFEKEGYGWHIGNNPGGSMLAAIPYALARPVIDRVVEQVNQSRAAEGLTEPPNYDSPWPMAREFYAEAWQRGFDVKFGLAAFVMQSFAMAPMTALSVVVMFYVLRYLTKADSMAMWLAILYAFGTPVFFRTGFLNHNLMLGIIAFMGFVAMWNPAGSSRLSIRSRYFLGGLAGGTAVLFDYSGVVFLLALFIYGLVKSWRRTSSLSHTMRDGIWYVLGSVGPILLLWFYQWRSFGHPFYPGQHWMPPVEWIELGYQGYGLPQLDLFLSLGFDYRYGLFVVSPIMLLALAAPFITRNSRYRLPRTELITILLLFVILWIFFSGSNYTRLQFNTGIRYMAPIFPFLFLPVATVLLMFPRPVFYTISIISVAISWSLAMYRDVESGLGMLNPILKTFLEGLQLPALSTLANMGGQYGILSPDKVSPIPLYLLTLAILYGLWSPRIWQAARKLKRSHS